MYTYILIASNPDFAHRALIFVLIWHGAPAACPNKMLAWMKDMQLPHNAPIRLDHPWFVAYTTG